VNIHVEEVTFFSIRLLISYITTDRREMHHEQQPHLQETMTRSSLVISFSHQFSICSCPLYCRAWLVRAFTHTHTKRQSHRISPHLLWVETFQRKFKKTKQTNNQTKKSSLNEDRKVEWSGEGGQGLPKKE
jgi:hypothetical protein